MQTIKEKLQALLCDPEGEVVIHGSDEDLRLLKEAIEEVGNLEIANLETGKKDQNGKSIKEGDSVHAVIRGGEPHFIGFHGEIIYSGTHACFGVKPFNSSIGASFIEEDFVPLHQLYEITIS